MTKQQFQLLLEYLDRIATGVDGLNKKLDYIENWTDINGNIPVVQK